MSHFSDRYQIQRWVDLKALCRPVLGQSLAQKQKANNGFAQFLLSIPKEAENTVADETEPARGRCDLELREGEF